MLGHSDVHRKADHEALRQLVQETQALISSLPEQVVSECNEDIRLALLGMRPRGSGVKRKGTASRPSKPELQMEDEFECDHSYLDG